MLLNIQRLKARRLQKGGITKTASKVIAEATAAPLDTHWDVFLSYSSLDKAALPLIVERLQEERLSVYVDAIADADLEPANANTLTAERIRLRLIRSEALFILTSGNVSHSRWVPWEIGFADGAGKRVAVLPFIDAQHERNEFHGMEYLGMYPYVDDALSRARTQHLWATDPSEPDSYCRLDWWLNGVEIYPH